MILKEKEQLKLDMDLKDLQSKKKLTPPHLLTNFDFEIQRYYQNEPRFRGVYSRDNLPNKIKEGAYVINLYEHSDTETHGIALYVNAKTITYFDSFGVKDIPKEIKNFFKRSTDKFTIVKNIFGIQAYDSVMCEYFRIRFIDFMPKRKSLANFTNLFSPNDFKKNKKNDGIILNYSLTNF